MMGIWKDGRQGLFVFRNAMIMTENLKCVNMEGGHPWRNYAGS